MTQEQQPQTESGNNNDSEALKVWLAKRDKLAAIELSRTLEALGASPNQDRDRSKWKIQGVGNIIVKRQSWLNGNLQIPGYGSVSLVRHAMDFQKDTEAMQWLAERFPEELQGDWKMIKQDNEEFQESSFRPPERFDDGLDDVRNYLINKRGLPASLIDREIDEGRLYATRKWDQDAKKYGESQAVFIGPSSAEIRSTDPDGFKGCCTGSDSERSGYQVMFRGPHVNEIVQVEAAVDALSHHAAEPGAFVISTNGAGRFELQYKLTMEAYRNGWKSSWGQDADAAGDVSAQRIFNALFMRDALAKEWDVTPDQIDQWMLQGKLASLPKHSPHELFLNDPTATDHAVYEQQRDESDPEKVALKMVDTGERKPATIEIKVLKACKDIRRGHTQTFELDPTMIADVLNKYQAQRKRPVGAKDWNEHWKRQGPKAVAEYEKTFQELELEHVTEATLAPVQKVAAQPVEVAPAERRATGRFVRSPR